MNAFSLSRRRLLQVAGGLVAARAARPAIAAQPAIAAARSSLTLTAAPARAPLAGAPYPDTAVWTYDSQVPGPEIRVRQGDWVRIRVENRLPQPTTVHWHGIRLPNAMDGVPHLTQHPIAPGGSFDYEFQAHDAGTFWYHPHFRSPEQVERGLSGALIVEERDPVPVHRELTWVLDDWRLTREAAIAGDFGSMMDISHAGRIGNTVTLNGAIPDKSDVVPGERLRLRLINAANARIFGLAFEGLAPRIIALDGQPVAPHEPPDGRVVLGPAMRADLLLEIPSESGKSLRVTDTFYRGREYRLLDLAIGPPIPLREFAQEFDRLPPNPLPEPDLERAERQEIVFTGGMMGGMSGATMGGRMISMRELVQNGHAWAVNGAVATGHVMEPMFAVAQGRTCRVTLRNETAWHHPIHLHGHAFRVLSRNGMPTRFREWQDTVLMLPREIVEIAFVGDNPGEWMLHCHILEHQESGMMGIVRVA